MYFPLLQPQNCERCCILIFINDLKLLNNYFSMIFVTYYASTRVLLQMYLMYILIKFTDIVNDKLLYQEMKIANHF